MTKSVAALEPFLVLSKSVKGLGSACQFIIHAISAPNLFVFGELFSIDAIKQVSRLANPKTLYLRIYA